MLDHPLPCCHGINEQFIPNAVVDLSLVLLFTIKHFIIALNPNNPQCNASKKVLNLYHLAKSLKNFLTKHDLFQFEADIIPYSNSTQFMHDEVDQRQTLLAWVQSQNLYLTDLLVQKRHKGHCLDIDTSAMRAVHSLTTNALCQMDHMNAASYPALRGSQS